MGEESNRPTTLMGPDAARRESLLSATFVEVADNLVGDYDVAEMLHVLSVRCVEIFEVAAAGIMLKGRDGRLSAVASSSEDAHTMDLLQLQSQTGPCWVAVESGAPVHVPDLESEATRWPAYVEKGLALGLASIEAVPLRLRDETVGALNLFQKEAGGLASEDLNTIQALADVATISLLQARLAEDTSATAAQLQVALDSRVVIEQAKGVVAEALQIEVGEAFARLRAHSRSQNMKLTGVCARVVGGELSPTDLV